VWKSEFVIYVDSDTEELRFETIEEALAAADTLGVDCQVFVEETGASTALPPERARHQSRNRIIVGETG
jgi:hypothetical protein